jgi:dTDP-4-dehydrorhamnose reductase
MTRVLLIGKNGQLGWELHRTLATLGELVAVDYPEIDLSKPESLRPFLRAAAPDLIVNAAAYTDVDRAESEQDLAYAINAAAVRVMAEEAKAMNAALIHYSTDYVFDGIKGEPYHETDTPNPLNVYGASKLAGEQAIQMVDCNHLILRTAWVYSMRRDCFVTRVLEWTRKNETLKIVDDQISNPTWARMLAEVTAQLIARMGNDLFGWTQEHRRLYHLAGAGFASRFEWVQEIMRYIPQWEEHKTPEIHPARTSDFPTPACRPLFTALNCDRFATVFGLQLPEWKAVLRMAMEY